MRSLCRLIFPWIAFLSLTSPACATHQVGGQLEMQALGDRPGHFRVTVVNYFEVGFNATFIRSTGVGIFRKRDNARLLIFIARELAPRQPLLFTNEACATLRRLRFEEVRFEADIQLNPTEYADPAGYYLGSQTENRNGGITNIQNPLEAGHTFYLEFPALTASGRPILNSSPRFSAINGEYVCRGEPFTFPFGGTDPDGDELRFSMTDPLSRPVLSIPPTPAPYPTVRWQSGFNAAQAIPGSPTLGVDARTGTLSVTATQVGLFVFAVKVEEFRAGQKIGETRREFQFLVIDCPLTAPPEPQILVQNQPPGTTEATLCTGTSLTLQATPNSAWNYQWRYNGLNIPGAIGPDLTVRDAGEYAVLTSLKIACGRSVGSQAVTVRLADSRVSLTQQGLLCADSGAVTLRASTEPGTTYAWFRESQPLPGAADSVVVNQTGRYWVRVRSPQGCQAISDTLALTRRAAVAVALVSASNRLVICPGDSLQLVGSGGIRYAWTRDGQALAGATGDAFSAQQPGAYAVTASDSAGCRATSLPLTIRLAGGEPVAFDSLPPLCGPVAGAVSLVASPPGGLFDGTGVTDGRFDPRVAGSGTHTLRYSVRVNAGCPPVSVSRNVTVLPVPTVGLPPELTAYRGGTIALQPTLTGDPAAFAWTPPQFLTTPDSANTNVLGLDADITYTLRVSTLLGCQAEGSVRIRLIERIWVPEAFSPNGDGLNDVWALKGIEAFPQAEVTVYDRWGEVIFRENSGYQRPFDGTLRGQPVPSGAYAYTLRPAPDQPLLRGTVVLVW